MFLFLLHNNCYIESFIIIYKSELTTNQSKAFTQPSFETYAISLCMNCTTGHAFLTYCVNEITFGRVSVLFYIEP